MNPQETQNIAEVGDEISAGDASASLGLSTRLIEQMLAAEQQEQMAQQQEMAPDEPVGEEVVEEVEEPKGLASMEKRIMSEIESLRKEIEDNSPKEALATMQDEIKKYLNDDETEKD